MNDEQIKELIEWLLIGGFIMSLHLFSFYSYNLMKWLDTLRSSYDREVIRKYMEELEGDGDE